SQPFSRIGVLFRVAVNSLPVLLVVAGCEPRAGLGEMPSRRLHDCLPPVAAGRALRTRVGMWRERGRPKPGRFGPGAHPVLRIPCRAAQPVSIPGPPIIPPRAMVTVLGTAGDQAPASRPGVLSRLLARSLASARITQPA